MSTIVETVVRFLGKDGNALDVRKTKGGMIPFDICENYTDSRGDSRWKNAISSSIVSMMQFPTGTIALKVFGMKFMCFPSQYPKERTKLMDVVLSAEQAPEVPDTITGNSSEPSQEQIPF